MRFLGLILTSCISYLLVPVALALAAAPTITAISPNNGTVNGGTSVKLTGTGFIAGTTVKFGATAAGSVVINSETSITAKSPASKGLVDIAATNTNGTSATTSADQFAYDPVPSGSWLGLNGNHLTFLGPVGFFTEHNASYDRVELTAGELPTKGDTLETAIKEGMTPVIPIEYEGYEGNFGKPDPDFPTEANGRLSKYVKGFVETASAIVKAYPSTTLLFEPMNEPWGYTEPIFNGAEYANVIAKLLPEAQAAGIPLNEIYVAAFGNDCTTKECGGQSCEKGCVGNGWIPAMYEAQPNLKKEIQGWYFHPYGHPSGSEFGDSRGVESLPIVQAKMTSGQNNIIISEMGFCALDVNGGSSCGSLSNPSTGETSAKGAQFLSEALHNAQPYYQAGWLRAILDYSRNDGGWATQAIPFGGFLTAEGSAFVAYADSEKVPTSTSHFGSFGAGEGQFETAFGAAVDQSTGNVYVSNTKSRVEKFDANGNFLANVGSLGSGNGQFTGPEALVTDNAGDLYVADGGNERIVEFNSAGEYQTKFGTKGTGNGQFGGAIAGLAVDSSGNVWASDTSTNERVEEFSSGGGYLTKFGSEGSENGQFFGPEGLAFSGGHLYVTDFFNHRVQEFSTAGAYLGQFGTFGSGNGQLEGPAAIASDARTGNLFIADHSTDRVEEFGPNGDFLSYLGEFGSGNGQFNDPKGVATSPNGGLYVVDEGNHRVDLWNAPGSIWEDQATPNPSEASASQLQGISCTEGCTAVGSSTNKAGSKTTLAEIFNGSEWTKQSTPTTKGETASNLTGVSCSNTKTCRAVGSLTNGSGTEVTLALGFNGTSWTIQSTPNPSEAKASSFAGIACASGTATVCEAVGASTNKSGSKATLAEGYNGAEWTKQSTPTTKGETASNLTGVSCPSSKGCVAVGSLTNAAGTEATLAMSFSGSTWTILSTPNPSEAKASGLTGVACASTTACIAVGSSTNKAGTKTALAESYNGSTWSLQSTPNPNGASASSFSGVACAAASACTAVGSYVNSAGSKVTLGENYNGTLWSLQSTPNPATAKAAALSGVTCVWITGCYAVGSYTDSKATQVTLAQKYYG